MTPLELYEAAKVTVKEMMECKNPDKYKELELQIRSYGDELFSIINTLLGREPSLYLIFSLYNNMKYEIDTKQTLPLNIKITRGVSFIMVFNPMYIIEYTLSELKGLFVIEMSKILLKHIEIYQKINPSAKLDVHNKLERASFASLCESIRSDVINRITAVTIPNNSYTRSAMVTECDNNTINGYDNDILSYYKYVDEYLKYDSLLSLAIPSAVSNKIREMNSDADDEMLHDFYKADNGVIEESVNSMIIDAMNSMPAKVRGLVPELYNAVYDDIVKSRKRDLSWERDLLNGLGSRPYDVQYTRNRLNRLNPDRHDLPGEIETTISDIVCVIDVSGSMSDTDVKNALMKIYNISKSFNPKITIIQHDYDICSVDTVTCPNKIKFARNGCGGTSHDKPIEYINNHNFKNAVCIFITDGYTDCDIAKIRSHKNIWLITGAINNDDAKSRLSITNPQGPVRNFKQ